MAIFTPAPGHPHLTTSMRRGAAGVLAAAGLGLTLLLGGCAPASAPAPSEADAGKGGAKPPASTDGSSDGSSDGEAGEGSATFTVDGREFAVALSMCSVYDGGAEVLLSGLATEVGGDATGFLDGDLTTLDDQAYGEFRIDIGATGPFESTDEFISMGDPTNGDLSLETVADGHMLKAKAWNENGDDLGEAIISFTC